MPISTPLSSLALQIPVDADACPVKREIYKVALRHQVPVVSVSNRALRVPDHPLVRRVVVSDSFDAADILPADRAIKAEASVLSPTGKPFTASSIGGAIATRAIVADLRVGAVGEPIGGPPPFSKAERSRVLSALDEVLIRIARSAGR